MDTAETTGTLDTALTHAARLLNTAPAAAEMIAPRMAYVFHFD